MLKSSLLLALILCASFGVNNAQDTGTENNITQYPGYVLTWNDEFNESTIDTTKWTYDIGNNNGWGNNELEYYTSNASNSFIQNGQLIIQANQENIGGFQYSSARMKTEGLFNTTYGKIEASLKLPTGQGIWPGFWMLGANIGTVGWPACGEIDIMEWVGNDPGNVHGSTHGTGFDTTQAFPVSDSNTNFHLYTVDWQPDNVQFSVDNNVYATVTPANTNGAPFVFDNNPMFILLNLAIGGNWPGNPDGTTTFPQQLAVDYVRVYEMTQSGKAAATSTTTTRRRKCLRR